MTLQIEWSREEDEKLLHLAKLMPTQWRTIAPIVGRTPSQCLERYEKLLDAACPKDENYEPGNDPRKLRPGEIDPNPESKPARPDPVDMDEDEKEMLSEARARLANTRGKKAKRKSREKQLEEARRLASLQKRRELKAAGIDLCRQKKLKRRRGIQYIVEIPFEKRPPPGFYDTAADGDCPTQSVKFPTTIEELEGERRVDKEAQLRKQDISRNKIALRQDAPSAILQANKLDNPESVRKMRRLNLPAPQIPDIELEAIAKIGIASDLLGHEEGNAATGALLASYAQTPRHDMTPGRALQRTPAVKQNAIMMEAENLLSLTLSQTPLLGGDNPMLHPSDFSGVIPKKEYIATPNPLSTPRGSALNPKIGTTPTRDVYAVGMTPRGTPMRDELRINGDVDMHGSAKLRQSDSKKQLIFGLKNLPQPKNDYQIVIQQLAQEDEEPDDKIEEDMSDRIAREKAEEEARQKALLKKRSRVLQRELPRPPISSLDLIRNTLLTSSVVPSTLVEQAHELVSTELLSLLENDNIKYPLDEKATKGKMKCGKRAADEISVSAPTIDEFDEDELKEADTFIEDEVQYLRVAMGHVHESVDGYVESHKTCLNDIMYFPTRDGYGLASVANHGEKLASLQYEFENVKKKMDDETKKAQRHEQKIKILTNGYQMRATKLRAQVEAILKQLDTAEMELECFQALKKQEMLSGTQRISNLWEELQKQRDLELTLQRRYGDLTTELEMVQHLVNAYRLEAERDYENAAKEVDRPDVGTRKVTEADAAGEDDEN